MSTKSATLRTRMDPALKQEAEAILEILGLNATTAITMLYKQIVRQRRLPLSLRLPNETTRKALEDAADARDLIQFDSVEQLKAAYK